MEKRINASYKNTVVDVRSINFKKVSDSAGRKWWKPEGRNGCNAVKERFCRLVLNYYYGDMNECLLILERTLKTDRRNDDNHGLLDEWMNFLIRADMQDHGWRVTYRNMHATDRCISPLWEMTHENAITGASYKLEKSPRTLLPHIYL